MIVDVVILKIAQTEFIAANAKVSGVTYDLGSFQFERITV